MGGAAGAAPIKLGLIGCGWYGLVDAKAACKAGPRIQPRPGGILRYETLSAADLGAKSRTRVGVG